MCMCVKCVTVSVSGPLLLVKCPESSYLSQLYKNIKIMVISLYSSTIIQTPTRKNVGKIHFERGGGGIGESVPLKTVLLAWAQVSKI